MIVISTHAVFLKGKDIYGPPHAISMFLNIHKIDHIFIKHRLEGDGYSHVEYFKNGKLVKVIERGHPKRLRFFMQYLFEILLTLKITIRDARSVEVYFGVDALNSIAGNILKLIGVAKKNVFFSADFALRRFDNPLLNIIYSFLDTLAMRSNNYTWSVSKRIVQYRQKKGLSSEKNLLFPNAPFFHQAKRLPYEEIDKHSLVIVSALEKGIAFDLLIDVFALVQKKLSNATLVIIGSGSLEPTIKKYVLEKNLKKSAIFKGALSHEKMFQVLAKCAAGIAFYEKSDKKHFRYFSDPMKVRDYLASGLPVFITGNSGIGEELEKENAGVMLELNSQSIYKKLLNLFKSEKNQKIMRQNAIKLAKKYDTFALLTKYFKKLDLPLPSSKNR